jgi:hypothetical protein
MDINFVDNTHEWAFTVPSPLQPTQCAFDRAWPQGFGFQQRHQQTARGWARPPFRHFKTQFCALGLQGGLKGRAARVRRLFPKLTWSILDSFCPITLLQLLGLRRYTAISLANPNTQFPDGWHARATEQVPFDKGTHGWQQRSAYLHRDKPIASLDLYCMFRNHDGTVWFDDVVVAPAAQVSPSVKSSAQKGSERT